jgi:hypothetical protein
MCAAFLWSAGAGVEMLLHVASIIEGHCYEVASAFERLFS